MFNALMIRPLGGTASGQLVGDTYAVQHPGIPERRAVQSVGVHLVALCATIERGWPPAHASRLRRLTLAMRPAPWRWLDPRLPLGTLTVAWPSAATAPHDAGRRVRAWAEDVWTAYDRHAEEVRGWVDRVLA